MGENKHIRRLIDGQQRTVNRHLAKIELELKNPTPDRGRIRGWEREIDIARKKVRKLKERLES